MFASLKNYIMGVLFILTCGFGYASYSLYGAHSVAQVEVVRLQTELGKATTEVVKGQQSCIVGQDITTGVAIKNNTQQEAMTKHLEGLAALPATTLQDTKKDVSKQTTEAPTKHADDARLSPGLMQLLDAAYCDSNQNDSACPAK